MWSSEEAQRWDPRACRGCGRMGFRGGDAWLPCSRGVHSQRGSQSFCQCSLFYVNLGASFSMPYSPAMRKAFRVHARTKMGEEDREGVSKCPGRARTPNLRRTLQKLALRVTVNLLPDIYLKEAKSETSVHKRMFSK